MKVYVVSNDGDTAQVVLENGSPASVPRSADCSVEEFLASFFPGRTVCDDGEGWTN